MRTLRRLMAIATVSASSFHVGCAATNPGLASELDLIEVEVVEPLGLSEGEAGLLTVTVVNGTAAPQTIGSIVFDAELLEGVTVENAPEGAQLVATSVTETAYALDRRVEPKDETSAVFTLRARKAGTYEGFVHVYFVPDDEQVTTGARVVVLE